MKNIITNHHFRSRLDFYDLTKKEQKVNDVKDKHILIFFRYRGVVYNINTFQEFVNPYNDNWTHYKNVEDKTIVLDLTDFYVKIGYCDFDRSVRF